MNRVLGISHHLSQRTSFTFGDYIAMGPLSIAASVTGVLAFAASTARGLHSLVMEIRDAREDISAVGRDVQSLVAVLASAQETCTKYDICREDKALAVALGDYLDMCQEAMQGIHILLKPLASTGGGGKRSPLRFALGWTVRKSEIRGLRARLNEGKASLNLTLSALNGLLEGKGQDDIRADIKDAYVKIMSEFRNFEAGKRVKRRIENDVASASTERGRRASLSEVTDPEFSMRRFLQPVTDDGLVARGINATMGESHNTADTAALLSPWASDPNAILEAVRARNQHLIETLLNQGLSLSTRSVQGYTVLHYCAIADDAETANLLIEHGADINAKDYELRSPFRLALASEALSVARLLSEKGCIIGDSSTALLRLTGRSEEVPGVRPLLQSLAKRLIETGQGPFLLHQAISDVDKSSMKILLDEGFSISKPDHRERGADVNQRITRHVIDEAGLPETWPDTDVSDNLYGATAVFLAARYKRDPAMTRFLIDLGADPDAPMWDGMGICARDFTAQAKVMVEGGSDINRPTHGGRGVLYWTTICENNDLMKTLIVHGGDVNSSHPDEGTLLMIAAARGNLEMTRMLVEAGADVFKLDKDGKTALQIASSHGKQDVVNALQAVM
ncbi:ankyrin [Verticillium alfalfae VaMs.102]|uniref:Ankyrin n=1 Tax=Verticillium alfalfae (strain VaMs.102 / ATCC MYA-4576 / FGSC 10136) TaxID=526221 RepID=C9SRG3_VERA1|nr:ankyrin [Verticillium alfalfae VaMs.102]EEY21378.1 ankyrin [Verticillium alfalfae VaMs.102]